MARRAVRWRALPGAAAEAAAAVPARLERLGELGARADSESEAAARWNSAGSPTSRRRSCAGWFITIVTWRSSTGGHGSGDGGGTAATAALAAAAAAAATAAPAAPAAPAPSPAPAAAATAATAAAATGQAAAAARRGPTGAQARSGRGGSRPCAEHLRAPLVVHAAELVGVEVAERLLRLAVGASRITRSHSHFGMNTGKVAFS